MRQEWKVTENIHSCLVLYKIFALENRSILILHGVLLANLFKLLVPDGSTVVCFLSESSDHIGFLVKVNHRMSSLWQNVGKKWVIITQVTLGHNGLWCVSWHWHGFHPIPSDRACRWGNSPCLAPPSLFPAPEGGQQTTQRRVFPDTASKSKSETRKQMQKPFRMTDDLSFNLWGVSWKQKTLL